MDKERIWGTEDEEYMKILLVDDRQENLLALEAVLKSPDYQLVFAGSGEEALKCLLKDDFAVILLDVQMPGMDGFETAKLVRARKRNEQTPIIFITAIYDSPENLVKGYSLGAIDYLFKPVNLEILKSKMEAFVKIHRDKKKIWYQNQLLKQRSLELERLNINLERTTSDLRKTEALASVIGETSIDTILTLDSLGQIINSNPAVTGMFGYTQEELKYKDNAMLFAENSRFIFDSKDLLGHERSSKVLDASAKRKDGKIFPVEIQMGVASLEDQEILVWSIRDLTERKQLEKERIDRYNTLESLVQKRTSELYNTNLKLKEEIVERNRMAKELRETGLRLNNILESITDVFFTLDQHSQFIFVNEQAEKYWMKGREELLGRNIWELFQIGRAHV